MHNPESRKKAALGHAATRAHRKPLAQAKNAGKRPLRRFSEHRRPVSRPPVRPGPLEKPQIGSDKLNYRLFSTGEIGDQARVALGMPWGMTSFGEAARLSTQPRPCQRHPAAITPNAFFVAPVASGPSPLDAVFWGLRGRRRVGSRSGS